MFLLVLLVARAPKPHPSLSRRRPADPPVVAAPMIAALRLGSRSSTFTTTARTYFERGEREERERTYFEREEREHTHISRGEEREERERSHTHTIYFTERERAQSAHTPYFLQREETVHKA